METEIKLLLPPGSRTAVEAHSAFAGTEPRVSHDLSTYYDTPDLALRRRGVSLRVRSSGDRHVQTMKWREPASGFASRGEREWPVGSDALEREFIARDPEANAALAGDLGRLKPVMTTDVVRTTRLVVEATTSLEAAIDEGEVRAGDRRAPLSEIEIELKAGPPAPVYRLAADLARQHGLRFGSESKAERGYALLTDHGPPEPDPAEIDLARDISVAEAVPTIVAARCRDLAADLAGAARGSVEGIHRLRATIRKLRTLLALFAPLLDPVAAARFNADLRELGRILGNGRDWDVFLTETLAKAEDDLAAGTLASLRARAMGQDRDAHAAVSAALAGPLPTDLLLGLSLWTAARHWLRDVDAPEADAPLRDRLPDLLDRLKRKAERRGRKFESRDDQGLHDLRKTLKKLRYACEDSGSLYGRKAVERYVGRIKAALNDLGRINDMVVAAERLADLADPEDAAVEAAADALREWTAARRARAERDLKRHWRRFRRAAPFWR